MANAEQAYSHVLEATAPGDASRPALVENLAASIYKQGEQANQAGDDRSAANHFVRVRQVAPTSKICAAAEYDAGAALLRLKDWAAAAQILEEFRRSFPEHELQKEATKQIAYAYQQAGQLSQSAGEYERVAKESANPQLRAEALLQAGDLYGQAGNSEQALQAYSKYVAEFPRPFEAAVETRSKIADIYKSRADQAQYHHQLEEIVRADGVAGSERTDRTRNVAARAALVLAQPIYEQFAALKLVQPFDRSLQEKQRNMDAATKAFSGLVDYQVGEVTAAATFYMAEIYANFSQSLRESQRPDDLGADGLKDYEQQLADAAHPLDEKSIAVHEKNLELMRRGLNNVWTQKSLQRLAALEPVEVRTRRDQQRVRRVARAVCIPAATACRKRRRRRRHETIMPAPESPEGGGRPAAGCERDRTGHHGRSRQMKSRADHGRATGARRVVIGLAVALVFLGCGTTVSAGKPRGADPKLQAEAGGFLLTENVRVSAEARADYDNALHLLEAKQYEQGIALLLKVTQKSTPGCRGICGSRYCLRQAGRSRQRDGES